MLLAVAETIDNGISLTNDEVGSINPKELLLRFCMDTAGYEPDDEEIAAFLEALRYAQDEGELQ